MFLLLVHGVPGVGVFAEHDPDDKLKPGQHERQMESLPEIAQERQFDRAEHTEPDCSQAIIPDEN